MKKHIGKRIRGLVKDSKFRPLIFILFFGLIGTAVILLTQAATSSYSVEPETSNVAGGATVVADAAASGGNAVRFTAATSGTCSGAKHTAGGDDGMGGCWPGPNNTGVPSGVTLSNYTGPCTVTTANTVIDSKNVSCALLIQTTGVIVRNSHLTGTVGGNAGSSYRIEDSWVDNGTCVDCSVGGGTFTVLRTEITGGNRAVYCTHCTVQDSWLHDTKLSPTVNGVHASAVRVEQYATLIHSVLACDYATPDDVRDIGCSADMAGYPDFAPIKNNTIDSNLFIANDGNGYCAYGGWNPGKGFNSDPTNATNIVFKNNIFQIGTGGCGAYGAITSFDYSRTGNQWTNNKYDNGNAILCDATHDCL